MHFFEYQDVAKTTACYDGSGEWPGLAYATLGLTGEAGEVANKVSKIHRDSGGVLTEDTKNKLASELGDVLWYLSAVSMELGIPLDVVAEANLQKLLSRKERGCITGEGDNR